MCDGLGAESILDSYIERAEVRPFTGPMAGQGLSRVVAEGLAEGEPAFNRFSRRSHPRCLKGAGRVDLFDQLVVAREQRQAFGEVVEQGEIRRVGRLEEGGVARCMSSMFPVTWLLHAVRWSHRTLPTSKAENEAVDLEYVRLGLLGGRLVTKDRIAGETYEDTIGVARRLWPSVAIGGA